MEFILALLETASVSIMFFLIKKYVLLEKDLPPRQQRIFFLITAAVVIAALLLFGKDIADEFCAVAVIVNIIMTRPKERRLSGLLLSLPFIIVLYGISNGIWVPIMVMPQYLFPEYSGPYTLTVYTIFFAAFAAFMILGKNWRRRAGRGRSAPDGFLGNAQLHAGF